MSFTRGEHDDSSSPGPAYRRTEGRPTRGRRAVAWTRALGLTALGAATGAPANTSNGYNLPPGVTGLSHDIYALHMEVFWVCVAIAIVVFGVMIYALVKFRHSQGAIPDTTLVHSTKVEIIWTIIPVADPGGDGDSGRESHSHDGGHAQLRAVHPGHRLSMEVAVSIHGRGRGDQFLLDLGSRFELCAAAALRHRPEIGRRTICWTSIIPWSSRAAPRCACC